MLNIVLFGPPGAGKGTQSEKLIAKYQLVHLSTGDILRSEIAAGSQLGVEAQMLMNAGVLVPDEVVIGMISSKLDQNKNAKGFIFDGFPRTEAQAEALDKLLSEKRTSITMLLSLEVSDEELTKRLLLRGQESGRPDDQNESIIRNRIQEYNTKTAPLKSYYSNQGKYRSVNGTGTVQDIFTALCSVIEPKIIRSVIDRVSEESSSKKEERSTPKKVDKAPVKQVAAPKAEKKVEKKAPAKVAAKAPAKKAAPKKAAPKKAAKKAAPKKVVKKAVKKVVKKAAKPARPSGGKAAPKKASVKKVIKKVVKKAAVKKIAKKAAPKKIVKKAAKKIAPKKVIKKAAKPSRPPAKKVVSKKSGKKKR